MCVYRRMPGHFDHLRRLTQEAVGQQAPKIASATLPPSRPQKEISPQAPFEHLRGSNKKCTVAHALDRPSAHRAPSGRPLLQETVARPPAT